MKFSSSLPKILMQNFACIVLILIMNPVTALAQHHPFIHGDIDAEIETRLNPDDADYAMTTREGSVDMLVNDDVILIQFSGQFLDELEDEISEEGEYEEASVIAEVLTSMISSGVRTLFDHALLIPIYEISEVYYNAGRLYIIDHDGEDIFSDLEIDEVYIMEDFSRGDARRFVAAVERRMI